ncbi:hypothetical protein [Celeribacter sp. PS-C1]|uniref:hypothetical protein n=1 Tax=Celeribacter sp. PS-C1 TaxID=2820813 RepID=UPI001CA5B112|nr:hypothetical protein [Celeribacter sp. PS-C1]
MRTTRALFWSVALASTASSALASDLIEEALGGPYMICEANVTWADETADVSETMLKFAVATEAEADRIALFDDPEMFSDENIWTCGEGMCSAFRTQPSGASTNVMRLTQKDASMDATPLYTLDAVLAVIAVGEAGLEVLSAKGTGDLRYEKRLPAGIAA